MFKREEQLALLRSGTFGPTLFDLPKDPETPATTTIPPSELAPLPDLDPATLRKAQERFNERQSAAILRANIGLSELRRELRNAAGYKNALDRRAYVDAACDAIADMYRALQTDMKYACTEFWEWKGEDRPRQVEYFLGNISVLRTRRWGMASAWYDNEIEEDEDMDRKQREWDMRDLERRRRVEEEERSGKGKERANEMIE